MYAIAVIMAVIVLWLPGPAESSFGTQFKLPNDPDEVLKEVLSREEFRETPKTLIDRAKEWLTELLMRILRWLFGLIPSKTRVMPDMDTAWFVLGCLVLGAAVVLACVIVKLVVRVILDRRAQGQEADLDPEAAEGLAFSSAIWKDALKQAEAGEYQRAVILLFRYVLIKLDELGRLPYHPGRTNGEILATLRRNDPLRKNLALLVPLFNRVRYGNARLWRTDFERFRDRCRELTEEAAQP